MGISHDDASRLTLWDYGMRVDAWDRAHPSEDHVEPPSIEETEERMRRLEARGVKVLH